MEIVSFTHPGEILREEFLIPLGITQEKLKNDLKISIKTISEICNEKRGITPLTAWKLARYFGTTPEFWMNLQSNYNLCETFKKEKETIDNIKMLETA